ncbi:hypothetical protein N781_03960 [Pontibacillus halophilus JSM 076056 = DSM 19796]|uniref:DUF819 family protein n=1 Tax=Pontibacillus halophilus JSM 076056 = DSM 19796 TaxID=1385510 RepID=A0A0A5GKF4_9BACI|nr:DUF819 family protein [Pontibacillus halophilus]KGX91640.1 hypothetical protein N781_03960 [Pontibacillus halophilus JSM 076056 = DSM 19796]
MNEAANGALIQDPVGILAYLSALMGGVFMLSQLKNPIVQKIFHYLPPLIWAYFLPMISTTIGITPNSSDLYSFIGTYILPFGLLLLLLSTDVKATLKLGPKALILFLTGTLGVVIGGPIALALFQPFLPEDAWKGVAALAGSWIGGSANMAALMESVDTPNSILSPIIIVDTLVGLSWMGVMIFLSGYQDQFNKWNKADNSVVEKINENIGELAAKKSKPLTVPHFLGILGFGFGVSYVVVLIAKQLPSTSVLSTGTWTILIISALGVIFSFTKVKELDEYGGSKIGYGAIYLLLTTFGAQANLADVVNAPAFIFMGIVWLAIHVILLFGMARLLRAPLFFIAVGSQGNIGGTSSAPIVASVFQPALAPVGLLMGITGNIVGTYAAVLCAQLAEMVATMM